MHSKSQKAYIAFKDGIMDIVNSMLIYLTTQEMAKRILCRNTQIKHMMLEVRREYEQRQGYEIDDKSRLNNYVQDRVALSNAFRPYSTLARKSERYSAKTTQPSYTTAKEHEPMMNTTQATW